MANGHSKKRTASTEIPLLSPQSPRHITSFSTASALSRQPLAGRNYTHHQSSHSSPPASAYFTRFNGDEEQTPSKDANAHFAYSTTLRRHAPEVSLSCSSANGSTLESIGHIVSAESAGIWDRLRQFVTGNDRSRLPTHDTELARELGPKALHETFSSVYAQYTIEETLEKFRTSLEGGLSSAAVSSLRELHGYNEFSVSTPEPVLIKFAKTIYESPLILLLFGSAVISAIMGNIDDAVSITIAILIVLTVGFVQEQRSEKSLEALNKLVPHYCHLVRDGQPVYTLANELLPGDVVNFSVGDRIPADLRLVSAVDLEIDESSLTGETRPAEKNNSPCNAPHLQPGETVALAERTCIAYMGTLVRNGHGSGVVIATGEQTEFGVIFTMMQDVEEKRTPLQLSMDELAKKLSMFSFGVIGFICIIGVLQQRPWLDMFTIGVSLAVAAIPEGLPIVTTVTLALGVLRMSRRKAIVKKLPSVEALGSVSVICSDKTGTLTMNEQTVTEIYSVDETVELNSISVLPVRLAPALRKVLHVGCLCNNAFVKDDGKVVGQSTDVALLKVLETFGAPDDRRGFQRLSEKSFNSEQKYMAVSGTHIADDDARERCYMKGTIEAVLDRCRFYYVSEDSSPPLDAAMRARIVAKATEAAARGLRVIALAYGFGGIDDRRPPTRVPSPSPLSVERPATPKLNMGAGTSAISGTRTPNSNLIFVGFQAMLDPPRHGVADSVSLLQAGGIQVVMITGDAEHTALAIARQLGLRVQPGSVSCLTGQAIDQMSRAQLRERVANISVFSRTTPRHKMAIVEAFRDRGAVVAMTGDGVNDAPALKMADIGVSMGKSGTDVAKEAADMILVDDNFSTILPAVEEGKSIFHNIQNFLSFQLSTAVAALTLITMSTFFGLSNPLNAMQILFINILMDGPPSQSLGVDPVDPAVMRRPPRRKDEPIISKRVLGRVLFSASIIVCGTLFVYLYALGDAHVSHREQTMTFSCFVFLDLVSALQNRGLGCGIFQNKMLLITISVSFISQLALVYVPFMQAIFQTEALPSSDLSTLLLLALMSFVLHEGRRRYERTLNVATYTNITIGDLA